MGQKIRNSVSRTGFVNRLPSPQKLNTLFRYDEITGDLYWKIKINPAIDLSRPIGEKSKLRGKRAMVRIDKILYYVSRVIWKLKTGVDPGRKEVDHEDSDHTNDSWDNLQLCTRVQNLKKTRRHRETYSRIAKERISKKNFGRYSWSDSSYQKWRKSMGYNSHV